MAVSAKSPEFISTKGTIGSDQKVVVTEPAEYSGEYTFTGKDLSSIPAGTAAAITLRVQGGQIYVVNVKALSSLTTTPAIPAIPTSATVASAASAAKKLMPKMWLDPLTQAAFMTLDGLAKKNGVAVGILVGASGYGKTSLLEHLAETTGRKYEAINCSVKRDPEEWFGIREAESGSTKFIKSDFAEAIEAGNILVNLDEITRIEPWLLNPLLPILDHRRSTKVHGLEIKCGQNVIIGMTANKGFSYTGTFELDEALENRADVFLRVGPMPEDKEVELLFGLYKVPREMIVKVVKACNRLRDIKAGVDASTRVTKKICAIIEQGINPRVAFEFAILARVDTSTNESKAIVDAVTTIMGELPKF